MFPIMPADCWVWYPKLGGGGFVGWWGGSEQATKNPRWLDPADLGEDTCLE